jgi:F0F1-type ATP synthase delta subunit
VNKKQIKVMAQRYKLSFDSLLAKYSIWKRNAIIDDIANKKNSGLLTEFIGNVIISAELQELPEVTTKAVHLQRKAAATRMNL